MSASAKAAEELVTLVLTTARVLVVSLRASPSTAYAMLSELTRAGAAIGRDRTTASHARDVIRALAENDDSEAFADWLEEIAGLCKRAAALAESQRGFEEVGR